MIDKVLKFFELVESIVMQHQRFIYVLLLIEEEQSKTSSKQLFRLLFEIVSAIILVGLVDYLDESFSYS